MRLRSLLLAAALFAATIPALATPQLRNGSDLWSGRTGPFQMRAFVTFNGFTATFQGAWVVKGHMQGVRLGTN